MDSIGIVFPRLFAESSTLAVESLGLASYDPAPAPPTLAAGILNEKTRLPQGIRVGCVGPG